jgi:hypothetical protein
MLLLRLVLTLSPSLLARSSAATAAISAVLGSVVQSVLCRIEPSRLRILLLAIKPAAATQSTLYLPAAPTGTFAPLLLSRFPVPLVAVA